MHEADWIVMAVILAITSLTFLRLLAAVREGVLKEAEALRLAQEKQVEEQATAEVGTPVVTAAV